MLRSAVFLSALFFFLLAVPAYADTIHLSLGSEPVKGLVVEEHADRIVLSTADGEKVFFRKEIKEIQYDNPEYSLLSLGREMEKKKRWGEAKSYFDRAYELNSNLVEARQAALAIQSRLWAKAVDEGPREEISKQQEIQDAWRANVGPEELAKAKSSRERDLWQRVGIRLGKSGDWIAATSVQNGGVVYKAGMRQGDEIVSIDGKSMRYLDAETVTERLLEPRYSSASLGIARSIRLETKPGRPALKEAGATIRQEYNGLTVTRAKTGGVLKKGDVISEIETELTRYMPNKKAQKMIDGAPGSAQIKIQRTLSITRN